MVNREFRLQNHQILLADLANCPICADFFIDKSERNTGFWDTGFGDTAPLSDVAHRETGLTHRAERTRRGSGEKAAEIGLPVPQDVPRDADQMLPRGVERGAVTVLE